MTSKLRAEHLAKSYGGRPIVKDVSLEVSTGEIVGLLGPNGAGKTTSFRMLTGDETPSSGDAEIFSKSLSSNRRKFLSQIGYCPQFDSIIPELTGKLAIVAICLFYSLSHLYLLLS